MQEMCNLSANCLKISVHLISSHFTEVGKNLFYSQLKQGKTDLQSKYVAFNEGSKALKICVFKYKWIYLLKFVPQSRKGNRQPFNFKIKLANLSKEYSYLNFTHTNHLYSMSRKTKLTIKNFILFHRFHA